MTSGLFAFLLFVAPAFAQNHSDCKMRESDRQVVAHGDPDQVFTSASLSKLSVTWWALEKLGPQYRFSNQVHVLQNAGQTRIHLEGGQDPIWSREKMALLKLKLQQIGFQKIDALTFDQNVRVYANLQRTPLSEGYSTPISLEQTQKSLLASFPGSAVSFVDRTQFRSAADRVYLMQGLPLIEILKYQNMTSNNQLADHLFWLLGGGTGFKNWLQSKGLGRLAIQQKNGSGLITAAAHNTISCRAAIEMIWRLQAVLKRHALTLPDAMLVEGEQGGTLEFAEDEFNRYTVKTGTLYDEPVLHVAGSYSIRGESYFFANLNAPRDREAVLQLRKQRAKMISQMWEEETPDPIFQVLRQIPDVEYFELTLSRNSSLKLKEKP